MRQDQPALSGFVERARADPSGTLIALDVDGTISEIAPRPADAHVSDDIRQTLERLAGRYILWFISGRDADRLREMVGVRRARYVGAHGLEVLDEQGLRPLFDTGRQKANAERVAAAVAAELPELVPYIERKRWSVAFHYRLLPSAPDVGRRLRSCIEAHLAPGLEIRPGKMVYEVTPAVGFDKGTALGWVLDTCRPAHALAAGDDATDVAMFRQLASRRASAQLDCLSVAVVSENDVPGELLEAADISVQGVEGLHTVLCSLVPEA